MLVEQLLSNPSRRVRQGDHECPYFLAFQVGIGGKERRHGAAVFDHFTEGQKGRVLSSAQPTSGAADDLGETAGAGVRGSHNAISLRFGLCYRCRENGAIQAYQMRFMRTPFFFSRLEPTLAENPSKTRKTAIPRARDLLA
jgi:hypothetical protein